MQGLGHVDCWFIKLAAGDHNVRLLYEQKNHQASEMLSSRKWEFPTFLCSFALARQSAIQKLVHAKTPLPKG
jgi:hypothetical protein